MNTALKVLPLLGASALALAIGASSAPPPAHGAIAPAPPIPQTATEAASALGDAYAAIVSHTKNSIVSVLSEKIVKERGEEFGFPFDDPLFRPFLEPPSGGGRGPHGSRNVPVAGLGSGFILDGKGHVLTNSHVVEGMEKIRVVLPDKESFTATVLGSDPRSDIAVIQLKGSFPPDLPPATLGDSDTLKAGHIVLAFGAPFGLTQTVTSGIISATGRSDVGIADFEDFVQTDAPINPGNSGGPLVNMRGEVVAINTAIAAAMGQSAGVGFAIPINMAKDILPTLLQGKKVVRGMLGISVQNVTPTLAKKFNLPDTRGALVSQVSKGSPGEKAGLRPGDVVVGFGGKPVADATQLREQVSKHAPGTAENVAVIRDGKSMSVMARLGELPSKGTAMASAAEGGDTPLEKLGIEAKDLNGDLGSQYGVKDKKGVVVTDVDPTSPAGSAGIRPGDVITEVDRKKVDSVKKADDIVAQAEKSDEVLLLVNHKGSSVYVTLPTG